MRAVRGALVVLALALVAGAYYTTRDDDRHTAAAVGREPAAGATRLTFAYSSNLEDMMATLLPRFNAEQIEVDGKPVYVRGVAASSGDAQAQIARGELRPDAWSPASSLWGRLLNHTLDRKYVRDENPSLASSPVAAGKREGLTVEDVRRRDIRAKVRAIEQSIVHYGDTGSFFAEQLAANGPAYASAVAMEETTLLEFNETRKPGELKLVAIYPEEGTYVSDNPYLVLDAPWVTARERRPAEELGRWLRQELTPQVVARFRYRPGDPDRRPLPPVTRAHGVDPGQPKRLLSLPEPRVLAEIKRAWHDDRKAANVLLLVDVSGSMNDENKIGEAKRGLAGFLRQLSGRDRVGLTTFSFTATPIVPVQLFSRNRSLLRKRVAELFADGETALYDGTRAAWEAVDALEDDARINAVVVLSDGADTASSSSLESLLAELGTRAHGEGRQIRIFAIAYGTDANVEVLRKIAEATGGNMYRGDPKTIEEVYLQISSYF